LDLYELEFILTLFKFYDSDVFYFILFEFMIKYLFFKQFCKYPWILVNMKKIGVYPHNGYPTDMGTSTGQIFIQRVRYGKATTRTLPAPL